MKFLWVLLLPTRIQTLWASLLTIDGPSIVLSWKSPDVARVSFHIWGRSEYKVAENRHRSISQARQSRVAPLQIPQSVMETQRITRIPAADSVRDAHKSDGWSSKTKSPLGRPLMQSLVFFFFMFGLKRPDYPEASIASFGVWHCNFTSITRS